jgi:hypothetical protein
MTRQDIEQALMAAETAVAAGRGVGGTGFWKAVSAVKADPALVEPYAERIGRIDRAAFEPWALFKLPGAAGTAIMAAGTAAGLLLVLWGYYVEAPWNGLLLLAGTGVTEATTHGLAHLFTGRVFGMRFTHWFVGSVRRPQPGVKVDYATYLRTPARRRAWMHASGAVVTKAIPFLALGPAFVMPAPWWTTTLLLLLGVGQVVTDLLWSVTSSDWKKYRREMSFARRL